MISEKTPSYVSFAPIFCANMPPVSMKYLLGMSGVAMAYSLLALPVAKILKMLGIFNPESVEKLDLEGKVAIVTGANTGIGKATARKLAANGATVILACRSMERANKAVQEILADISNGQQQSPKTAPHPRVMAMELDLSDLRSVRAFAASFLQKFPKLDILVNNAGLGAGEFQKTKQGIEMRFAANYLGHFLLTNLVLDKLKSSPDGRIVNLSSVMHHAATRDIVRVATGEDTRRAYQNSKLAMLMFTVELRRRLAGTRILATAVNPGFVASDIWRNLSASPSVGDIWNAFCSTFALTVEQGAGTPFAAAALPRARLPRPARSPFSWAAPGGADESAVYLQPYLLLLGITFPFEIAGPYAGPRAGLPTLPVDEPAQSAALWRHSELLCAAN